MYVIQKCYGVYAEIKKNDCKNTFMKIKSAR